MHVSVHVDLRRRGCRERKHLGGNKEKLATDIDVNNGSLPQLLLPSLLPSSLQSDWAEPVIGLLASEATGSNRGIWDGPSIDLSALRHGALFHR